jgi:DNA helicase-2/ATP-dependent DNA helicase PcrA
MKKITGSLSGKLDKYKRERDLNAKAQQVDNDQPHIIMKAYAGTGKTTTLAGGVAYMFKDLYPQVWKAFENRFNRFKSMPQFEPSPQQQVVWEQMRLSAGKVRKIKFGTFSNSIVGAFVTDWKWLIDALSDNGVSLQFTTMHKIGYAAVRQRFGSVKMDEYKVSQVISQVLGEPLDVIMGGDFARLTNAVEGLVTAVKLTGIPTDVEDHQDRTYVRILLEEVVERYGLDWGTDPDQTCDVALKVIDVCKEPNGVIDFNDQIWLPMIHQLPMDRADLALGDEGQDWNRPQQWLAGRMAKRLVMAGDSNQAIYGFTFADTEGMATLKKELERSKVGCIELPLTYTRRCSKAIVAAANEYVPDFMAFETNREGSVNDDEYPDRYRGYGNSFLSEVADHSLIISRTGAVASFLGRELLRNNRNVCFLGKDLAKTIKKIINNAGNMEGDSFTMNQLRVNLTRERIELLEAENNRKRPRASVLDRIEEVYGYCSMMVEGCSRYDQVMDNIDQRFNNPDGIRLGTVHSAKGLEAENVYICAPRGAEMPHKKAKKGWEIQQEYNLIYVALTRGIDTVTWVT